MTWTRRNLGKTYLRDTTGDGQQGSQKPALPQSVHRVKAKTKDRRPRCCQHCLGRKVEAPGMGGAKGEPAGRAGTQGSNTLSPGVRSSLTAHEHSADGGVGARGLQPRGTGAEAVVAASRPEGCCRARWEMSPGPCAGAGGGSSALGLSASRCGRVHWLSGGGDTASPRLEVTRVKTHGKRYTGGDAHS